MQRGVPITKQEFIERSRKIHGDWYDYSLVEFKAVRDKVKIVCPEHGEFEQKVLYHLGGSGCQKCSRKSLSSKQAKPWSEILEKCKEKYGDKFTYDESTYQSFYKKMKIICPEHGEFEASPDFHLNSKNGCKKCNSKKLTFDEFLKRAIDVHGDKYDYSLAEKDFDGSVNNKVSIICPIHGIFKMTPRQVYKGHHCHKCAQNKISQQNSHTIEDFIKKSKEIHGNTYDYSKSKYSKKNKDILIICRKHGEFWQRAENHWNGAGCPTCTKRGKSKQEKEVVEFIKQNYSGIVQENIRKIIPNAELDIYIPDLNFAIEFDGIYWHTEDKKGKTFHIDKTIKCQEKGIQLYHIFSNEWEDHNKREIWKSIFLNKLGSSKQIYARKCIIKEIDSLESKGFLLENHLQGNYNAKIRLGLFYKDELISVMTFSKPRYSKKFEYELIRFASKKDMRVVGGASKLFKYFTRTYNPESILSYADLRYGTGGLYEKLGFTFIRRNKCSYFYTRDFKLLETRFQFQKHKLKEKLEFFDPELTEFDNMKNNGYNRIWDCGNNIYEWYKQS